MVMAEQSAPDSHQAAASVLRPEGGYIASAEVLQAYCSLPPEERPPLDAACRGVLAETALTGRQRYEWQLLVPLLHKLLDSVLAEYIQQQEAEAEVGPPRPPPPGYTSPSDLVARLHSLLDTHGAAPFTLQRLCEVLLEPRKQYARFDKVGLAIEKLLMVTSTRQPDEQLPPLPLLSCLGPVNENPPSPYLDGRPPQVLDQQQHQALLQQQAQAMAAAQQHHHLQQQQQHSRQLAGLANGVDEGPQPLEAADGDHRGAEPGTAAAAAAAAEAMQLDMPAGVRGVQAGAAGRDQHAAAAAAAAAEAAAAAPPALSSAEAADAEQFVESALADAEDRPAGSSTAQARAAAPAGEDAGSGSPTPPDQQPGGQHGAGLNGQHATAASLAAAALGDVAMAGAEEAPAAGHGAAPSPQQQQPSEQQEGPQPMDVGPGLAPGAQQQQAHPAAAGAAGGAAGSAVPLAGLLRQHLPEAVQAVLLPALAEQQQQEEGGGAEGGSAAAASAEFGSEAGMLSLVGAVLEQLPPGKVDSLMDQLRPLLPPEAWQQLQQ